MKLYYKSGSCSLAPHIILEETNLQFELEYVDLITKKTEHGKNFLDINPKGQVPALLLNDGSLLSEGVAILQYIADQAPDRQLIPAYGKLARYHVIEWLSYLATELHKGFSPLYNPNVPEEYKTIARNNLTKHLLYLNHSLENQHFLVGTHFGIADAYLFTVLRWLSVAKLELKDYPVLERYFNKIAERPAVISAMQREGLLNKNTVKATP